MWTCCKHRQTIRILLLLLLSISLTSSCDRGAQDDELRALREIPANYSLHKVEEKIEKEYAFLTSEEAREALKQFLAQNNCRLAQKEDFQIPDQLSPTERADWQAHQERAYYVGDLNNDQRFLDFAVLVVKNQNADAKNTDANRFSFLVFNQPTDFTAEYQPIWIQRQQDLRYSMLTLAEGQVVLRQQTADNKIVDCALSWDKSARTYRCLPVTGALISD
jgi:hypothetical protein